MLACIRFTILFLNVLVNRIRIYILIFNILRNQSHNSQNKHPWDDAYIRNTIEPYHQKH